MHVPDEDYRGVNAYFCASVVGDEIPKADGTEGEPIKDARFIDVANVPWRDIHPVDRKILQTWTKRTIRAAFDDLLTLHGM
jgi:hypothetical protein